jgi:hypothetical protein
MFSEAPWASQGQNVKLVATLEFSQIIKFIAVKTNTLQSTAFPPLDTISMKVLEPPARNYRP